MTYERAEWRDWLKHEDRSAVFVDGHVIVLSDLATALVEHVGRPELEVADLVQVLEARFGKPADLDSTAVTQAALDELVGWGVLRLTSDEPGA